MSHQHDDGCGFNPEPVDPAEFERNYADNLRSRAQTYLTKEDAPLARDMLVAARSLLKHSNGLQGEKLVWLLVAEAHLPMLDGKTEDALKIFEDALTIATNEMGDHLTTAVCALNCADLLLELHRQQEAKPLYERAHNIFQTVAVELQDQDEYLSKFAHDGSALALHGSEVAQTPPTETDQLSD